MDRMSLIRIRLFLRETRLYEHVDSSARVERGEHDDDDAIENSYQNDPQIDVVSSKPDTAICVQKVDVLCVCNSHYFSGLAPFFIDPRA